jgi:beta-1,4-mannosyl-glycoprotein beta-1,4-N-acetylglucosaminyltransferase
MMKVIDAFCYFNEADLCTIRLEYYKDVVDHFVILESTHTWRGTKNEPNFMKNVWPHLSDEIRAKVYHKIIDHPDEWLNEESWRKKLVQDKMRDSLVYEARELMGNEDAYFIYNDLDEFWDKRRLPEILHALSEHRFVVCWQEYRIVYVDWMARFAGWGGSRFATLSRLPEERPMSYGKFKYIKNKAHIRMHPIFNGWHFSYFGTNDAREAKLKSIKDTRNWEQKVGASYSDIAKSVNNTKEWNMLSRKSKQKADPLDKLKLDPELETIFKKYPAFFSPQWKG